MTKPTQHGQVPEALRLAEQYDHGDPAAHGNAWKAAVCTELRRQHASIAELEAQIAAVGAGGVQALSAAPEAIAKLRHLYQNMVNGAVRDTASAKRIAEGLLAPAIEALERATPPAEQQAATKAAPGELHDHQILAITTAYEQGVGKGRQAYGSGKEISNPYDTAYRCDLAWQYGYEEGKEQAERIAKAAPQQEAPLMPKGESAASKLRAMAANYPAGHLWDKLDAQACAQGAMEIEALRVAPQQEAQEPGEIDRLRAALVYTAFALHGTPQYMLADGITLIDGDTVQVSRDGWKVQASINPLRQSAQPAPAPLSDDAKDAARYRWLRATTNFATNSQGERIDVRNQPEKWDAAIDAALAAQGGK